MFLILARTVDPNVPRCPGVCASSSRGRGAVMSSAPSVRAALVAGLHALETRVATGRWGSAATTSQLNAGAEALPASLGRRQLHPVLAGPADRGDPTLADTIRRTPGPTTAGTRHTAPAHGCENELS